MIKFESFLFLTLVACLFILIPGCAEHNVGSITVSQPRVWHDDAVVASIDNQLSEIDKFKESVKLEELQGKRARRYYKALGLSGALSMQPSSEKTAPDTTSGNTAKGGDSTGDAPNKSDLPVSEAVKAFPSSRQTEGLKITEFPSDIKEDPLDRLQRVDDFYQELEGKRLTHLRDTASIQEGWSVYLLGFDISLVPGDKTSKDHGAYVEFTVKGKRDKTYAELPYWPKDFRFPECLKNKISYDPSEKLLVFKGVMSSTERDTLLNLFNTEDTKKILEEFLKKQLSVNYTEETIPTYNELYKIAVDELFEESQINDAVRVYNVWPQRYADRFAETSSIREDFILALKGQVSPRSCLQKRPWT